MLPDHIVPTADNVRLLPHRFFEVAEGGHELLLLLWLKIPCGC
jgi:hypothetical protein